MVVRRGGNFDLPGGRQLAINRQHLTDNLTLFFTHAALIGKGEITAAAHPFVDFGVVLLKLLVEPCELRPHLQVAKILHAKRDVRAGVLLPLPRVEQLAVAGIAIDQALRIGIKGVAEEEGAIGIAQILGGLERGLQKGIDGLTGGVLGDLGHHRRHQVECLPDFGKLLQHANHAVVILERVHARPGQFVFAGDQVLVEGLVHVPEEAQVYLRHPL